MKKTGYQVDRPGFGVIQFDEREINNSLNYKEKDPSAEDARRTGFLVLKDVLKRGIEISGHENHKGRGYETLTIAAPVEINGQRGNMAVVVKQTKGNQYKVHRILTPDGGTFLLPEMANAEMNTVGAFTNDSQSLGGSAPAISSASDASVTSNGASVKPELSDEARYSLAGDTADGLDLSQTKRRLVNRTMNHAAKELRGLIDADTRAAREVQQNQLAALGRDILQKGSVPQSQVIDAFETIWAAGRQVDTTARDDAQNIRDYLRQTGVSLAAEYRADVNGGDWNSFQRQNFGRLKITTDGLPVDQAYAELSGQRPDLFPADIANPADQIQRMAEVAEQLRPQERDMDALYGSAAKGQIEAAFIDLVDQMQQAFNPRERTFTAPAEWGDTEAEEADALWRLNVEADGEPVQDAMEGFQQPVQPRPAPVRLDSRAMGQEDLVQQVRQTAAKYGQEGKLTPRDPDEAYHLDWVELMSREGDDNQARLEQRRTRWKGEAQKMQAAGASREEILMRTGWI